MTIPEVYALADAIDQRYRALVLLGIFGSLRWGELAALRRRDIDLEARTIWVERQLIETISGAPSYRRAWLKAVDMAGLDGVHFHDLRHTGNALTAGADANLREPMERMGHASTRAALTYLHSTDERQRTLADAVGMQARAEMRKAGKPKPSETESGTEVARRGEPAS